MMTTIGISEILWFCM